MVIKERLPKFFGYLPDVDFNAKLKTSYNKEVFINAAYEEKKPGGLEQAFVQVK